MSDFRIENGELVEYTGKGGDVVIPDSAAATERLFPDGRDAVRNAYARRAAAVTEHLFPDGRSRLTSISVPDSVTSIEAPAFTECENLQDFTCPSECLYSSVCGNHRTPYPRWM